MKIEQIADMINRQRLHLRKDGQPVTSKQVYAVVCSSVAFSVRQKAG